MTSLVDLTFLCFETKGLLIKHATMSFKRSSKAKVKYAIRLKQTLTVSTRLVGYVLSNNQRAPEQGLFSNYTHKEFYVLTKCSNKFDCLIKEMLFIRRLKPKRANGFDSRISIHLNNL